MEKGKKKNVEKMRERGRSETKKCWKVGKIAIRGEENRREEEVNKVKRGEKGKKKWKWKNAKLIERERSEVEKKRRKGKRQNNWKIR